jgi:hypothetical protein
MDISVTLDQHGPSVRDGFDPHTERATCLLSVTQERAQTSHLAKRSLMGSLVRRDTSRCRARRHVDTGQRLRQANLCVRVTGRYSNRQITQLAAQLLDWTLGQP